MAGLVLPLLWLSSCGKKTGTPAGPSTPQEVHAKVKAAAANGDLAPLYEAFDPQGRGDLLLSAYHAARFSSDVRTPEGEARLAALLKRHGVAEVAPASGAGLEAAQDKARLFSDLLTFPRRPGDGPLSAAWWKESALGEVRVDGDRATGALVVEGVDWNLSFFRRDGAWFFAAWPAK
jgi:hypothetical protein